MEPRRLNFDEFASHLANVFDTAAEHNQTVLVERGGQLYKLEAVTPQDIWAAYDPKRVQEALRQSAGALAGVNRDELLADIHAQREQDSQGRPA